MTSQQSDSQSLREPLLQQGGRDSEAANNNNNESNDVEAGTTTAEDPTQPAVDPPDSLLSILRGKYRRPTFAVATLDGLTGLALAATAVALCGNSNPEEAFSSFGSFWRSFVSGLSGLARTSWSLSFWKHPFSSYSFGGSFADVLVITGVRSIGLMVQSSCRKSTLACKIAGYGSLMSLLFGLAKIGSAYNHFFDDNTADTVDDNDLTTAPPTPLQLQTAALLASLFFSFLECCLELLVGINSTVDMSETSAPTAAEAAAGIAFSNNNSSNSSDDEEEEIASIGIWELAKVLKPYFWPGGLFNRCCVLLTWAFLVMSKASNILAPLAIARATDELASGHRQSATRYICGYAGLLLANKVLKECQALAYVRVKLIAGVQLREEVFGHLLGLSMDWHQRKSMGAVVTAMQRGITASNMVVQYLFLYLFPTGVEAMVVVAVFVKHFGAPLLAAVAVIGCTVYTVVTIELTVYRMQFRKTMNKADNDASHKVTDALLNMETVKYFCKESHELSRYRESVNLYQDSAYKIQGTLSLLNTSQQIVLNLTLVAALLVAANEYYSKDFSIGMFVAVNVYVLQLFAPLNFLGTIYGMALGAYVDLQNLCNILAQQPDIVDRPNATELTLATARRAEPEAPSVPALAIEFQNVVFSYPSRKEATILDGVSFKCAAGTVTAVVGATGAGKSTLTKLLFRFYEADGGRVLVGGKNVLYLTQNSLRKHIGVVPQDHVLFNDTLEYNIQYGSPVSSSNNNNNNTTQEQQQQQLLEGAIRSAELEDFIKELPKGLETVVGERGQQVSGGQKQRVAIARVLLKESPICVLDEATSSLDSNTEQKIQESFAKSFEGRTVLVIAHRLSTIQNADQIVVLSKGKVLEIGSHEDLLSKGTWHDQCYASLWDKQKKAD